MEGGMDGHFDENLVTLDAKQPIWGRFYTVSPLVMIGSRDRNGEYNLAPKQFVFSAATRDRELP